MRNTADNLASELLESLKVISPMDPTSPNCWASGVMCCYYDFVDDADEETLEKVSAALAAAAEAWIADPESAMPAINYAAEMLDEAIIANEALIENEAYDALITNE